MRSVMGQNVVWSGERIERSCKSAQRNRMDVRLLGMGDGTNKEELGGAARKSARTESSGRPPQIRLWTNQRATESSGISGRYIRRWPGNHSFGC